MFYYELCQVRLCCVRSGYVLLGTMLGWIVLCSVKLCFLRNYVRLGLVRNCIRICFVMLYEVS